ncbi:MAG TPA: GNAT family N-acetyltransferase [Phycisphaerales bacterium]|nr:GNAT family N-acetyltransferase [Phycisphaerales bacterium]
MTPPTATPMYGPARESDMPALVRLMHHAFASTPEVETQWLRPNFEHFRVVRDREGGAPSSCLLRVPMGQYFGGRAVSMLGIAGVAVAPEARGKGSARWMMARAMEEAREDGFALSTLYASTQGLYRQVGYEQGGYRCATRVLPYRIDVRAREPMVRHLSEADEPAVRACYDAFAPRFAGALARGEYCWKRTRQFRDKSYHGFGIDGPGGTLEGYVFLVQSRAGALGDGIEVEVSDLVFSTARAGRRLLGFLADFSTTTKEIALTGAPMNHALSLLTSHHDTISHREVWMLRITDIARALTERGYPRAVSAAVRLDVHDPVVRANDGSWTLSVEHGRAEVKREATARPAITATINGLAAVYSGMYTATQAAGLGWVEGDRGALKAGGAVVGGGGVPWMGDFF